MYTNVIKNSNILLFGLALCIFMPKINIINLPGSSQGIRYDDVFIMFGIIIISLKNKLNIKYFPLGLIYFNFYSFLLLIAFMSAIAYGATPIILVLKWIEYSLFFVLLHYAVSKFSKLHYVSFSYIIINFILVLLQKSKVIGCIYSIGYKELCHERPAGISGGAWELPIVLIFMFIPIMYDYNINRRVKTFFLIITSSTVFMVETRSSIIILVVSIMYFIYNTKYKKNILFIIITITILVIAINQKRMGFIYFSDEDIECTGVTCNYHEDTFKFEAIPYLNHNPELTKYIPLTMIARLGQWDSVLKDMDQIDYIFGKGLGYSGIFKEGMYIKILTDLGVVGILLFSLYYYRLLKNYKILAIILGIGCLTIDALSASKIMFSFYYSLFYFKYLYYE